MSQGIDELALDTLKRWWDHPEAMVREEFGVEPDAWQLEALQAFPHNDRIALKACKGPGKTAVLAWLILNFMATRPNCRIAATSITGANLASNLWPELAKWMGRSKWFSSTFKWSKHEVTHRAHPATWWCQFRTWPKQGDKEEQAHALAGLHEDYAMGVVDESSEVPQAVMATVEAVLGSGIETKVLQAGNPTRLDGPLYRACIPERKLWYVVTITGDPDNPKRSPRIKLTWARQEIEKYGRDNPWVKVNVLGEFPEASINALMGPEDVERAFARKIPTDAYEWVQKKLGVDVARFGDDRTVIYPRQGLWSFKPVIIRKQRTTLITARIVEAERRWGGDPLIIIDQSGGWGQGTTDQLIQAGRPVIPVLFGDKPLDRRYKSRRVEMWLKMRDWIVDSGGRLYKSPEIIEELTVPTYSFVGAQFVLEDKDQIKERLGRSPDLADALALTFAMDDMPAEGLHGTGRGRGVGTAMMMHDPHEERGTYDHDRSRPGKASVLHDPFED